MKIKNNNGNIFRILICGVGGVARSTIITIIRVYQLTISPDHGVIRRIFPYGVCRYTPTCSQYTIDAIRQFGVISGMAYALIRIFRCHPFANGGYDPVCRDRRQTRYSIKHSACR